MPADIESRLRDLGQRFRAELTHVDPDEILNRSATQPIEPGVTQGDQHHRRHVYLFMAAASVTVVALVSAIWLRERDDMVSTSEPASSAPPPTFATATTSAAPSTQPTSSAASTPATSVSTPTSPIKEPAPLVKTLVKTAVVFQATGSAVDICGSAAIAVSDTGYEFDGFVLEETTSVVDGIEWRWLLCTGDPASGWGVTVLVSTDSATWKLTDLGMGGFVHAGDEATMTVDGARATVRYQSLVGERRSEATTTDTGTTWSVFDDHGIPPENNGCDRPPPDRYDDTAPIHTIPEATNAADITIAIHVPLRTICPGGELPVTLTVTNTTNHDSVFAPGTLILTQGPDKWPIGDIPDTPLSAGDTTFLTVQTTIPEPLRPGTYEVLAYGYTGRTSLTISPPP